MLFNSRFPEMHLWPEIERYHHDLARDLAQNLVSTQRSRGFEILLRSISPPLEGLKQGRALLP
jgi:hypothetical protein